MCAEVQQQIKQGCVAILHIMRMCQLRDACTYIPKVEPSAAFILRYPASVVCTYKQNKCKPMLQLILYVRTYRT